MSIEQVVDLGPGGFPPGPWVQPAELAESEDAWEESLLEAAACGDVGFADRMETGWWPEIDDSPPAGWAPVDSVPADPLQRLGPVGWLQTRARELNREQARFLAAVHQAGHAQYRYDDEGYPRRDAFATDEVGKALGHSTAMAGSWLSLAEAVIERLPRLHEAMAAGWLDVAKARVLVADTGDMPADLAGMVVTRVLPLAPGLTKKMLAARVEIAAAQLDPDWYARRAQAAHARARVEWARNPTGTGEVALRDVGAPAAAAIKARVDALAEPLRRAARRRKLPLGLPALRALAAQRLLDGTYAGLDDDTLLARLTHDLPAWHTEITGDHEPNGPDDDDPDDPDGPDDSDGGPDDGGPDDDPKPDDGGPGGGDPDDGDPNGDASPEVGSSEVGALARPAVVRAGTVELRLRLSTTLGLDDLPGELPGTGPLAAHTARRMLTEVRHGDTPTEWRLVLVDDTGHLEHVLLARPDPPRHPPPPRQRPLPQRHRRRVTGRVIIELAVPTATLAALDPADHPHWAGLIRRAQTQLADLEHHGAHLGGPHHPATTITDARQRFPGAALQRFIRVRDRYCIGPLCTGVAHHAEIDHTRDWIAHGLTMAGNLGPPCRRCHRLKHTGDWQLTQPTPGTFAWRTPLGATYTVPARRVLEPALEPAPRTDGRPRPVLRVARTARPDPEGWLHRRIRLIQPDDIPTPPSRRPTSHYYSDEPPF